ncbi:hypothetical protein BC832DRAFT_229065 [Gaertneriomyces semiglobifer]|nr:hypothetical protein BC832DRAFT_229065 [Gaertneriomyces semiglobifer]
MDLTLSLHPSPQELASRSRLNTHILIEIHMGHPKLGSVTIPVLVQEAGFEAQVRLYLKLSSSPPFLKLAKFTLLNRPLLDFAVSPLKLGNIMNMPLLSNFIMSVIDTTVESMLVSPHVMALDLERMLMGDGALKKTRAIGVIKVVFRGAKGLRAADWGGTSDPFATLSWGTSPKLLARTRIIPRDRNPVWNETQYVTVTEDDVKNGMPLSVKVWDFDAISRNEVLGMFEVRTEEVVDGCGTVFDGWKTLLRKGGEPEKEKKTNGEHDEGLAKNGKLDLQLGFYPKVDTREVRKDAEKYRSGILAVQIHQAMDLLLRPKDRYGMYPSPYIAVYLNDQKLFQTRVKHHNPSPMYAVTNESFIRDWTSTTLRLVVKDARLHEHDPVIGVIMLDVHQLLEKQEDMFESSWHDMEGGIGFGRVRVSLAFRPVMMEEPRNMRGAAVGEVVMSDFRVQGLEKVLKHLNAEEAAKGGAPAPPAHLKLVCRSPLTEPTRVSTHLATEASFKPSWDTEFRMRVKSRYQTAVRFELHQKNLFGLRDKVLAIGKLFLQDLNDGDEQDVVLALKRWKRGKKSKALDEEDHFGSTQIGDVYSAQREHGKDVVQGERAVRQGTATDMEGRPVVEGAARAEGVDSDIDGDGDFDPDTRSVHSVDSAETDSISSFESDGDEVAGDNERRGSVAMSERRPSTAYSTDFESITSDQDVGTSQRRPSRTTDPVADGVTNDAGGQAHDAPTSLSSPAVRTHPTLTLKIRFSPGRTWISTPRVGEEQEMEYLEHSEAQEQLEADTSASLHPPPKASKLFNPLTSASVEATNRNHPTKHKKKRGTVSGKQSEDSRLPGNKLTRTLEWSKDTLVEGMKSTRLWKKNQRKSVTSLEM